MLAIFKRDFRSYFHSFTGSLFIGAVLFITGIYVTVYNLLGGVPKVSYALSSVLIIFMITIPVLTMKVLAEDRKQKTDQLLLTAPISVGKIVFGKFMALTAVFNIPVLIICCYPIILNCFGEVPILESYVAIVAFYLYGLACIAIGVFVSSLTESQVIAAVLSFGLLFLGYMMSGICGLLSSSGNWLTTILSAFDLTTRYDSLIQGTFDVKSVVYFITLTFVFLFLTTQSIQKRRYSVSVKKIKMGVYSMGMTVAVVAGAVLLNLFVAEIPAKYTTLDVTAEKLYSLTDETKELVEGLKEEIKIYVLANENAQDSTLKKTLEQYAGLSEKIQVSYVDPMANPKFHTQYTDAVVTQNSLIIESEKRSKVIDYGSIYETSIDYTTYTQSVSGYDGEGQITSAIAYVTSADMPKMYFIEGHGELALETSFYDTIEKANIEYETINLLQHESVPEDAECIVINAPTTDFSQDDTNKVLDYLEKGGNALIVTTWTTEDMSNFKKILAYYEVTVADGMILEGDMNSYYQSPFYLLPTVAYDAMTSDIYQSFVFVPYAQGLLLPEETADDLDLTALISSSEQSYVKAEISDTMDYEKSENDLSGPFVLGVKAEKQTTNGRSIALIYSSENLFTDSADIMVSGTNMKLFSIGLDELVDATVSVAIPAKGYEMTYLTINQTSAIGLGLLVTMIIPFALLIGGLIVWFRRRRA